MTPRVALMLGDPAGVGPELVAKLLADPEASRAAEITIVGDPGVLAAGMEIAGVRTSTAVGEPGLPGLVEQSARGFVRGEATAESGQYILATFRKALDLARDGKVDALCFAPLNKTSLHLAGMRHEDELRWFADELGYRGPTSELNVLDELWTARVTSHIPLKDVAGLLTPERIVESVALLASALQAAGKARPRIAVCGLNPHAGDNGNFGREEIDVITPAVRLAQSDGVFGRGPVPGGYRVRPRAGRGVRCGRDHVSRPGPDRDEADGLRSRGDGGGGLPLPVTTPAHGTAFDIVGRTRQISGPCATRS